MTAYVIVPLGSEQPTLATPTEGRWYAGYSTVTDRKTGEKFQMSGEIAKFVDGEFVDEDGEPADMSDYETLVEQR